jgi:5-methylcytosine-specific restriction protein A
VSKVARLCLRCARCTTAGSYCPDCARLREQERAKRRGTSTERGYDSTYRTNRKEIIDHSPVCWWCGSDGTGRGGLTADHLVPLSQEKNNGLDNLVSSCGTCNYSRGGRQAHR